MARCVCLCVRFFRKPLPLPCVREQTKTPPQSNCTTDFISCTPRCHGEKEQRHGRNGEKESLNVTIFPIHSYRSQVLKMPCFDTDVYLINYKYQIKILNAIHLGSSNQFISLFFFSINAKSKTLLLLILCGFIAVYQEAEESHVWPRRKKETCTSMHFLTGWGVGAFADKNTNQPIMSHPPPLSGVFTVIK